MQWSFWLPALTCAFFLTCNDERIRQSSRAPHPSSPRPSGPGTNMLTEHQRMPPRCGWKEQGIPPPEQ